MSTGIEWTDETWNPVTGCSKVSQGCKNCYAERIWPKVEAAERMREHLEWQKAPKRAFTDVRVHPLRLDAPMHWAKPRRIFVNSMSDLFHEDVPFEFIGSVFAVMSVTTRHTYQVLTKRPQRMLDFFKWDRTRTDDDGKTYEIREDSFECGDRMHEHWPKSIAWDPQHNPKRGGYDNCGPGWPYENVWLGVSVEDQETADERIPLLLQTPAAVRFLSCEPLLGPMDIAQYLRCSMGCKPGTTHVGGAGGYTAYCGTKVIDWVIAGGESGPKARPSHPDWFRSLRDQCAAADAPFFFKQWGEFAPTDPRADGHHYVNGWASPIAHTDFAARQRSYSSEKSPGMSKGWHRLESEGFAFMHRVGKKAAGRLLDGREHMEYPK